MEKPQNFENSNINEFAKSGISYEAQTELLDDIKNKTEKINAEEGTAAEAKEYILTFYDRILESIKGSV